MKLIRGLALILALTAFLAGSAAAAGNGVLFQISTIQALLNGVYDGDFSYRDLKEHGDFGLGTFNALDGEMVAVDGKFYQIKADGKVYPAAGSLKTPFAAVTFFKPDRRVTLREPLDYQQLQQRIAALRPTPNLLYAIKIEGIFAYVKARSVPRQHRPYPGLAEATQHQTVFEFRQVPGVMVGFLLPDYLAGINAPGYHFHFITADRTRGGHLLDCLVLTAKLELQQLNDLQVQLPRTADFYKTELVGERRGEVEQAEK